jgi:hypothetical protein
MDSVIIISSIILLKELLYKIRKIYLLTIVSISIDILTNRQLMMLKVFQMKRNLPKFLLIFRTTLGVNKQSAYLRFYLLC